MMGVVFGQDISMFYKMVVDNLLLIIVLCWLIFLFKFFKRKFDFYIECVVSKEEQADIRKRHAFETSAEKGQNKDIRRENDDKSADSFLSAKDKDMLESFGVTREDIETRRERRRARRTYYNP